MTEESFVEDFVPIYYKIIDAAIVKMGFLPQEAVGECYLTAEIPGFENKYLRLLEEQPRYELRLYSNCMSFRNPFFSK